MTLVQAASDEAAQRYPYHPICLMFPDLPDEQMEDLVEDIRRQGLLMPIWLYQGQIVDGRHRYEACLVTGIEPRFSVWEGTDELELIGFVVGLNKVHRHMSQSQWAITYADKVLPAIEAAARKRREYTAPGKSIADKSAIDLGKAADIAGALAGVSGDYIGLAKKVTNEAPELIEVIRADRLSLPAASEILKSNDEEERTTLIDEVLAGTLVPHSSAIKRRKHELLIERRKQYARDQVLSLPRRARIWHQSFEDWLPQQEPCDLLLTDPPYSTDIPDIQALAHRWMPVALAKVKPTGRAYIFIGSYPDELLAYLTADRAGMELVNILVWTYQNRLGPSPKMDYKMNWQAILYFFGPHAPPLDCPDIMEQFSVHVVNVPDPRVGDHYHKWQKPDELAERLVRHATKPGDLVLDPFAGTGALVLAAERLGRVGLGCEIDDEILTIAEERGCVIERSQ